MRKRDRQRFVRLCNELIARLGGVPSDGICRWELATRYGPLGLTVSENRIEGPGTVFTRFDDPQTARRHVDCNPYSGKWNHHYFDGWTVEAAIADLERWLRSVLPTSDNLDTDDPAVCSCKA
jgi:hypothetical protein